MKISVIGAGGVGGYFGARLAKAGHDVQFLARGRHLQAMRENGLRIESPVESFVLENVRATDDAGAFDKPDIMLVATKLWDLAETGRQMAPAVGERTVVVPLQNGVDAVDILSGSLPAERVAAGVAIISAQIGEPGTIRQTGPMARLRVGALHSSQRETLQAFVAAGAAAGFAAEFVDEPRRMLWEKFVMLNALAGVTSLTRQTVGAIRDDPQLRAVLDAAIREGIALAQASGASLAPDYEAGYRKMFEGLPADMRASMAHDLLAGRKLEAPWLCGAVVRRAEALGVPVPVNATIWAGLKPFASGG
ncbi:MAG TPA: 2-dehydropantoate 2-reductase [Ramlibacter sp.]|uniref:ketopantoate reductase family protein n=1 Tax=Ramlibacter sp. TaxID=1917967 RepID=UPI002D08980B|nr:2-dehydropantoate 2-reductase [Ramlibacter sp.]HVZ42617.1 2-dehydropantoate 2-reductase [Ramlibacter sp.]